MSPQPTWSALGQMLAGPTGIRSLMDDLGKALTESGPETVMMGGGNPAHIPAVEAVWQERLQELAANQHDLARVLGDYDIPQGRPSFIAALADYINEQCGWDIGPEHIAITNGSQTACFMLFNLLAGQQVNGRQRRLCFPMVPEYIGYADQLLSAGGMVACRPRIEHLADHTFRYHVDWPAVEALDDIAIWSLSRPTNPTARVADVSDINRLVQLANQRDGYVIVDNAYGHPFPGAVFTPTQWPAWHPRLISTLSLSKLGLPGTRTGIAVGSANKSATDDSD